MYLSRNQRVGYEGELYAQYRIERLGYDCQLVSSWTADIDLVIYDTAPIPVEVKLARGTWQNVRGCWRRRWQWNLSSHTIHHSIVVLIAEHNSVKTSFVLPGWLCDLRSSACITSFPHQYSGWMSDFREQWRSVIEDVKQKKLRYQPSGQLNFFNYAAKGDSYV